MNKTKRIIAMLLTGIMLLGLFGCSGLYKVTRCITSAIEGTLQTMEKPEPTAEARATQKPTDAPIAKPTEQRGSCIGICIRLMAFRALVSEQARILDRVPDDGTEEVGRIGDPGNETRGGHIGHVQPQFDEVVPVVILPLVETGEKG